MKPMFAVVSVSFQTINDLHLSNEKITKIRGVFNSLELYFLIDFLQRKFFSTILKNAEQLGLTKSDSRQDLSGIKDAKTRLLI